MNQVVPASNATPYEIMEKVIAEGDLSKLTAKERVTYYNDICKSIGLNPLTRPFEYIRLNGKLTLYARKDCTEQLRRLKHISIVEEKKEVVDNVFVVTAYARSQDGLEDVATGAVNISGLTGENLANAFMKAETKAKRRVTLSICGLGFVDESEVDSIPNAQKIKIDKETGEIEHHAMPSINDEAIQFDQLLGQMERASSLTTLQNIFNQGCKLYANNAQFLSEIVNIKDKRKVELTSSNPEGAA